MRALGASAALAGAASVGSSGIADPGGLVGWVLAVIERLGPMGIGLLVALENLFPPIPSEVILPLAGFTAAQGEMHLGWAIAASSIGALAGAWCLYGLGAVIGRDRLRRWFARLPLFDPSDIDLAERWFARFGSAAVLVGRCIPVVRSLISIPAGVARMPALRFSLYTLLGSTVWNTALVGGGYLLGEQWEDMARYSEWINRAVYVAIVVLLARFVWLRTGERGARRRERMATGRAGDGSDDEGLNDAGGVDGRE